MYYKRELLHQLAAPWWMRARSYSSTNNHGIYLWKSIHASAIIDSKLSATSKRQTNVKVTLQLMNISKCGWKPLWRQSNGFRLPMALVGVVYFRHSNDLYFNAHLVVISSWNPEQNKLLLLLHVMVHCNSCLLLRRIAQQWCAPELANN